MDRLIAPNSVAAGQADVAPTSGTPQFATDGNPATGTPATQWPAYAWNAVQEELIAIITGAGIAPDRTKNSQVLAALEACFSPVVGSARNVVASVSTATSSVTISADEIVVKSALGGMPFVLKNFSKTVNLAAAAGPGGMDTGSAPASGYVGIYAIYNPTTGTSALLAVNATSTKVPEVYGGANMPAGYTASALVSVWGTTSSGQLRGGSQFDRRVSFTRVGAFGSNTPIGPYTAASIATAAPRNAKFVSGNIQVGANTSGSVGVSVASDVNASDYQEISLSGIILSGCYRISIFTPQTMYYSFNGTPANGPGFTVYISAYEF